MNSFKLIYFCFRMNNIIRSSSKGVFSWMLHVSFTFIGISWAASFARTRLADITAFRVSLRLTWPASPALFCLFELQLTTSRMKKELFQTYRHWIEAGFTASLKSAPQFQTWGQGSYYFIITWINYNKEFQSSGFSQALDFWHLSNSQWEYDIIKHCLYIIFKPSSRCDQKRQMLSSEDHVSLCPYSGTVLRFSQSAFLAIGTQ